MPHHKPRQNEDEYFAKLDAEKIEKQRTTARELANLAERASHYGRCPKCGASLAAVEFHGVTVDQCPECHGLWLTADEIEAVVAHEDHSLLRQVVSDVMTTLKGARRGRDQDAKHPRSRNTE